MKIESLQEKISKQEERLRQLKAQQQALLAREKAKQKEQERKDDTRRKILLGSYMLEKMQNEFTRREVLVELDQYLMHDRVNSHQNSRHT